MPMPFQQPPPWQTQPYCMPIQPYQGYAHQASPYPYQQQMGQPSNQMNNQRKRMIFYCHTHGACFHPGIKCCNKGPNHQDNATFTNRMGGSTKNVRGVPQQQQPAPRQTTWRWGTEIIQKLNKINHTLNNYNISKVPPTQNNSITIKADSGAAKHYFREEDIDCLSDIQPTNGPVVYLPNMNTIPVTHKGTWLVKNLSQEVTRVSILPQLKSASLLSLEQLCDDDCDVILQKKHLHVIKNNQQILHGQQNFVDGLWDIQIPKYNITPVKKISVIIPKNTTKHDLARFYHVACFSPPISTFYKAVKNGNFQSWPGLSTSLIKKFLKPSIEQ